MHNMLNTDIGKKPMSAEKILQHRINIVEDLKKRLAAKNIPAFLSSGIGMTDQGMLGLILGLQTDRPFSEVKDWEQALKDCIQENITENPDGPLKDIPCQTRLMTIAVAL